MKTIVFALFVSLAFFSCKPKQQERTEPWSTEQANRWYESVGWLTGVNYIISDAVNSIEMFDKTSYNPELLVENNIGSFMWGLVNGKTQTHLPWGTDRSIYRIPECGNTIYITVISNHTMKMR